MYDVVYARTPIYHIGGTNVHLPAIWRCTTVPRLWSIAVVGRIHRWSHRQTRARRSLNARIGWWNNLGEKMVKTRVSCKLSLRSIHWRRLWSGLGYWPERILYQSDAASGCFCGWLWSSCFRPFLKPCLFPHMVLHSAHGARPREGAVPCGKQGTIIGVRHLSGDIMAIMAINAILLRIHHIIIFYHHFRIQRRK